MHAGAHLLQVNQSVTLCGKQSLPLTESSPASTGTHGKDFDSENTYKVLQEIHSCETRCLVSSLPTGLQVPISYTLPRVYLKQDLLSTNDM